MTFNRLIRNAVFLKSAFLALCFAFPVAAQDGKALYQQKGCVACHGAEGAKPLLPNYPVIAGQNSLYVVLQLKDYKSGKRNGTQAALMKSFAVGLTEPEMKAIADYLQSVKR